jgi:hypothetical protein
LAPTLAFTLLAKNRLFVFLFLNIFLNFIIFLVLKNKINLVSPLSQGIGEKLVILF